MNGLSVAAVDLGASSGRVMLGRVGPGQLQLEERARFANEPVREDGTLRWDVAGLWSAVLDGLRACAADRPQGIGIDSWAVDYGLLDASGSLLGDPFHYRDARTDGVLQQVVRQVPEDELYAVTGLQQLPFNTLYQLVSEQTAERLARARTMLLIPDLFGYWLTGVVGAERTNASTTQLFDVERRDWARDLADRVGVPTSILPALRDAGSVVGPLLPELATELGLAVGTRVVAVGSHDTASAVVGVPGVGDNFAYISCGTWSLVGVELDAPVLTRAARQANFTNEAGVDGTIRFLRNVMGLWLLQESRRSWGASGNRTSLVALLDGAARERPFRYLVDPDDPAFLPPGDMPARIAALCRSTGQEAPGTPEQTTRCILDSLALAYRRTVRLAAELSGREVGVVHIVGGGAHNAVLCQLTADACGLPVLAGPVEATALGNIMVQARTLGADLPDLAAMRSLVRETQELVTYQPAGDPGAWAAAEARVWGSE